VASELGFGDTGLGNPCEESLAGRPGERHATGRLDLARCLADKHHPLVALNDVCHMVGRCAAHGQASHGVTGLMAATAVCESIKVGAKHCDGVMSST
jgi:hypothetical protein